MSTKLRQLISLLTLALTSLAASEQPHLQNRPICVHPPIQPAQTYFVSTSHGKISVLDSRGNGRPVLFVHGNSFCKEIFSKQFSCDFLKKYRFIAIDLPGHGQSDKAADPEKTYCFEGYSAVVKEIVQKLELKNPAAVGWSLGGNVLLNNVAKGEKFAGVLITGTPPIELSFEGFNRGILPLPSKVIKLLDQIEFSKEDAREFIEGVGCDIDLKKHPFALETVQKTDGFARRYLMASMAKNKDANQKTLVENNDTLLCVVLGADERAVNISYVMKEVRYRNLFNQKVYLIPNAGHSAFWDHALEFNQILDEFLSSL